MASFQVDEIGHLNELGPVTGPHQLLLLGSGRTRPSSFSLTYLPDFPGPPRSPLAFKFNSGVRGIRGVSTHTITADTFFRKMSRLSQLHHQNEKRAWKLRGLKEHNTADNHLIWGLSPNTHHRSSSFILSQKYIIMMNNHHTS